MTKKSQLVPLPRKPSIDDILQEYKRSCSSVKRDSKASSLSRPPAVLDEVLEGLKLYFNKALGNNLLYRFERAQYVQAGKEWESDKANEGKEMEPSKVYGAEHLLRLFGECCAGLTSKRPIETAFAALHSQFAQHCGAYYNGRRLDSAPEGTPRRAPGLSRT